MASKEATARIKINKLLEGAGWRFFPEGGAPANIRLEPGVTIKSSDLEALGENFEKTSKGFIDFLLLDTKGFPLIVLEAKSEDKNPLVGKEQARKYAKSQNCRFVILSNGNLHYFWPYQLKAVHALQRAVKDAPGIAGTEKERDDGGGSERLAVAFKLFDFFANCEYFEEKFNYDEVLKLPRPYGKGCDDGGDNGPVVVCGTYEHLGEDILFSIQEVAIGYEGMKIDRMFFERFEDAVRENEIITRAVEAGQWDRVIDYVNREVFDKPEEYYNLQKLQKAAAVDRQLTLREILEKIFGLIPRFKSKDELLEEEFAKFVADTKPEEARAIPAIKTFFKAYVTSDQVRHIIENRDFTDLATNTVFSTRDFRAVPEKYRTLVPEYVKDYVSLNQFAA